MPSDPRTARALAALAQPIAEFRSLVDGALAQADDFLSAQDASPATTAAAARRELGPFADGRIDAGAFAALFPRARRAEGAALDAMRRAATALRDVAARGNDLFTAQVPPGGRMLPVIDAALSAAGRAFGAVMVTELVRGGRYVEAKHGHLLDAVEFREWTRSERRFAPPLVVEIDGADLHPGPLSDYADGREKLVLVVRGPGAPAPLARCISPGTFVLQTVDGTGLETAAAFDGPAIAACVGEGAATFVHDPAAGREPWQRLTVHHLPEPPRRAGRGLSAFQMSEDLRLLADMARTPFAVPSPAGAGSPAVGASDAVERIASWLLTESGLPGKA